MPRESVFCLALSRDLADQIVARVRISGFSSNDVSALFPDRDTAPDLAPEKSTCVPRRERPSGSQRTARRSGFASIGALTIPGVGPFVAAGPIIFALSGAVVGCAGGAGLAGALIDMGVSEFVASRYESNIKEGNILISVHAQNSSDVSLAKTIFREAGAHCICATHEASFQNNSAAESVSGPSETTSSACEAACGGSLLPMPKQPLRLRTAAAGDISTNQMTLNPKSKHPAMKSKLNHDNARRNGPQLVPVRFEFTHPTAITVSVAGTFNDWHSSSQSLRPSVHGRWLKETALLPGTYEYCLVVDGQWMPDPLARETVPNPFGGRNSILQVASSPEAAHLTDAETLPLRNTNKQSTRKV